MSVWSAPGLKRIAGRGLAGATGGAVRQPPPAPLPTAQELGRRRALWRIALLACGAAGWSVAFADTSPEGAAFRASTFAEVLAALGPIEAAPDKIDLAVPDLVENGAVVPVAVSSRLAGPQEIYIVVEANPNPLAAHFTVPAGTEPFVATRVKVAQSCSVYALVAQGGRLYAASRDTKVTIGGCGG